MTREEWLRIKSVAAGAWDLPAGSRATYVETACAGDQGLRDEVDRLLRHSEAAASLYETPALGLSCATLLDSLERDQPSLVGTRIGPYVIERELGHGGMGAVYLAVRADGQFDQRVAIKVVDAIGGRALVERFAAERRILATLNHPYIARLLDGGVAPDGRPALIMEFVDGAPIDEHCERQALDISARLALFRSVCRAVHYAHQRLVVHRDIKPGNILVTPDGTPKLLDFGIAKILEGDAGPEGMPRTIVRALTLDSASPEQVKGEPITIAADVYSLGVLLYRLLTGRRPYAASARSEAEVFRAICETDPPPPGIDRDLDLIVLKALRKEPERRYGSVEQFSDDLDRYLAGKPVTVAPDSVAYRTRKFVARHRVAAAIGGIAVAGILAAAAIAVYQARVAEQERARAERHFSAVRSLAASVLGELHDAVAKLPGSTAAQAILLARATDYLDRLAAEAVQDVPLRREVARGYQRLGQVQGLGGMPNLGNRDAARASYKKSIAVLAGNSGDVLDDADRLVLAESHVRLAQLEDDTARRDEHIAAARTLLAVRTAPLDARALDSVIVLWGAIATNETAARNYRAAKVSLTHQLEAAEAVHRLEPHSLNASRNLSLAYKRLGAIQQQLGSGEDPMPLYEKARQLDQARVDRDPGHALWRLDLSFSYGSIASVLSGRGDITGATGAAEKALALRREVATANPDDDFARTSLARGYDRLAGLRFRAGNIAAANEANAEYLGIMRRRLAKQPDRADLQRDFTGAGWSSVPFCLQLAESDQAQPAVRAAVIARTRALLAEITAVEQRSRADGQQAASPSEAERRTLRERLQRLERASK